VTGLALAVGWFGGNTAAEKRFPIVRKLTHDFVQ